MIEACCSRAEHFLPQWIARLPATLGLPTPLLAFQASRSQYLLLLSQYLRILSLRSPAIALESVLQAGASAELHDSTVSKRKAGIVGLARILCAALALTPIKVKSTAAAAPSANMPYAERRLMEGLESQASPLLLTDSST